MAKPKIVIFDIEILTDLSALQDFSWRAYPGFSMGANVSKVITFGYKVYGENKTHALSVWNKGLDKKNKKCNIVDAHGNSKSHIFYDDKLLCEKIYPILADADALISFNGRRFDLRFLNARFLKHGLPPLPEYRGKHIDLFIISKEKFKMSNRRLSDLGAFLGIGSKIDTGGKSLWDNVAKGDKNAQKKMDVYCKQDVDLLEQLFEKMKPMCRNLPVMWVFDDTVSNHTCPLCSSSNLLKRGFLLTAATKRQRWQCKDCGAWSCTNGEGKKNRCL